jgi:hypothetical protein
MDELDELVQDHLVVRIEDNGMYSMTSRNKQLGELLEEYGDTLFDASKHGGGSNRQLH